MIAHVAVDFMIALASRVVNILKLLVTPPQQIVIRDIITLAYPEGQYTQMNRKSGGYKIHTENSENGSRMRRFTIQNPHGEFGEWIEDAALHNPLAHPYHLQSKKRL